MNIGVIRRARRNFRLPAFGRFDSPTDFCIPNNCTEVVIGVLRLAAQQGCSNFETKMTEDIWMANCREMFPDKSLLVQSTICEK